MTECQLAGVGLGIGHKLLHIVSRKLRFDHEDEAGLTDFADRSEVFYRVIRQLLVQADIGGLRGAGGNQKGVAICRRTFDRLRTQNAIGTCPVLDVDRLAQYLAHALADDASHRIGGTAGAEGHDKFERLVGVGLGPRGGCRRAERQQRGAQRQVAKGTA